MGLERQYILTVGLESEEHINAMEDLLQEVLLDLYDEESVESIKVVDNNTPPEINDDDMTELIDILERLDSRDIMGSIEIVRNMEEQDDSGDDE